MKITPFDAACGAEVTDLDLTRPLDLAVKQAVNRAFVDHAVMCFRDQNFESPDEFLAAASNLGDPMPPVVSTYILPGSTAIEELTNRATDKRTADTTPMRRGGSWHTDHSNLARPPKATTLYAIEIPIQGGNTEFTDMRAAYNALSGDDKAFWRGRRALHRYLSSRAPRRLLQRNEAEVAKTPDIWQPIVRRHDETGRAALYLNPMRIEEIEDLASAEAHDRLDALYAHCDQPRFQYSHAWRLGDMLIWDNRATMHQATFDFDSRERRYLHRIMLQGTEPLLAD